MIKKGRPLASTKILVSGTSGRYATAIFELAVEAKAVDTLEADVAKVRAALTESPDFQALVSSPLLSRQAQSDAVRAVGSHLGLSDLTQNFLGTLAANRRLTVLAQALTDIDRLIAAHRGELSASVTSAVALTKAQTEALRKTLKAGMGRDVAVECTVDESLLGGLVVQIGSRMIDSSLKTKLSTLSVAMKGVQ